MSETPITDKAEQRWKNDELSTGGSVYASDMRALELAANGLRDALEVLYGTSRCACSPNPKAKWCSVCCAARELEKYAAFQKLQPYDAPNLNPSSK